MAEGNVPQIREPSRSNSTYLAAFFFLDKPDMFLLSPTSLYYKMWEAGVEAVEKFSAADRREYLKKSCSSSASLF